jgi:hypothetical protein
MSDTNVQAIKPKRSRSPNTARPAFVVLQMLDENGEPHYIDKKRIKIVAVERNAEKVMELTEEGNHPHAIYLRVVVPVSRTQAPRTPKAQPAAA